MSKAAEYVEYLCSCREEGAPFELSFVGHPGVQGGRTESARTLLEERMRIPKRCGGNTARTVEMPKERYNE